MYREEKWFGGKLFFKHTPSGEWEEASTEATILWLYENLQEVRKTNVELSTKVDTLEEKIGVMEHRNALARRLEAIDDPIRRRIR